jgi:amidase
VSPASPTDPTSAAATAAAVRAGSLDPVEVVDAALERIAALDPVLNAFRVVRASAAREEARALRAAPDLAHRPLAGVPMAIKDNVAVAGEVRTDGSAATARTRQPADHEVVRRLRAAGAIVVGITTCPELCLWGATDGPSGLTRNPWDLSRTPGGSSGGSAAAVAGGLVPLGHANDGLGSIRIPAAACGLVGIKPGRGVVPSGLGTSSWFGLSENGPLARSVEDAALGLAVMAARPTLAEIREQPRLRIGVSVRSPLPTAPVHREWADVALATAERLASAGHAVVEAGLSYPSAAALALTARWLAGAAEDAVDLPEARLEPRTRRHVEVGRRLRGRVRDEQRHAFRAHVEEAFRRFDVLLTPTLATDPIAATLWSRRSWRSNVLANTRYGPLASPWNLAGYPAMAVPVPGASDDVRPRSVQLVAPDGAEARLLGLAAEIESLAPWPRVAPLAATASPTTTSQRGA